MNPAAQLVLTGRRKSFKIPHVVPDENWGSQVHAVDLQSRYREREFRLHSPRSPMTQSFMNELRDKTNPVGVPPGMMASKQVEHSINTHRTAARHGRVQVSCGPVL